MERSLYDHLTSFLLHKLLSETTTLTNDSIIDLYHFGNQVYSTFQIKTREICPMVHFFRRTWAVFNMLADECNILKAFIYRIKLRLHLKLILCQTYHAIMPHTSVFLQLMHCLCLLWCVIYPFLLPVTKYTLQWGVTNWIALSIECARILVKMMEMLWQS